MELQTISKNVELTEDQVVQMPEQEWQAILDTLQTKFPQQVEGLILWRYCYKC